MDEFWTTSLLVNNIGEGSYAKVYSILDSTDRSLALKVHPVDLDEDPGISTVGLIEINLLKLSKDIPEIIDLVDIHFHPKRLGLTLPLFPEDLIAFINRTSPNDRLLRSFDLIRTLVRAEAELNRLGYHHFDIKPGNILVSDNRFVLADMGLSSTILSYMANPRINVQTIWYRAPEHLVSRDRTDFDSEASEMWSIGLVGLEMITGYPIFKCNNRDEILNKYHGIMTDLHLYGIKCIQSRIPHLNWYTILKEGGISGRINVQKQIDKIPDQIDKLRYSNVIQSCEWMLELDPWDRVSSDQWLRLFDTPLPKLSIKKYNRKVNTVQLTDLIKIGSHCKLSRLTLVLSCDIFSRYASIFNVTIIETMACLRLADHLINYGQLTTSKLFYVCQVSRDRTHEFVLAERKIVKELAPLFTLETKQMINFVERRDLDLSLETGFVWLQKLV